MKRFAFVLAIVVPALFPRVTGATQSPVPAPTPLTTATPATSPSPTPLWQIGSEWVAAQDGQCGTPAFPTTTSVDFVLVRNGTSCKRNQLNPVGNGGSGVYRLNDGQQYTWRFQTVTNMGIDNGRYSQRLVFQIHQYACGMSPNTVLGIQNLTGTQVWYIVSGGQTFTLPYTEGATDTWQFTATIANDSSGTEQWSRNGALVASTTGPNYTCGTKPFWNFGPYSWQWAGQGGGASVLPQVEILFNYMQLTSP